MGEFLKTPFTEQEIPFCYSKFPCTGCSETFVNTGPLNFADPIFLQGLEKNIYLYIQNDKNINTYTHTCTAHSLYSAVRSSVVPELVIYLYHLNLVSFILN